MVPLAGGDFNGFHLTAPLSQLQADKHEGCFAGAFIPPRDVDEEISSVVGDGGVVAVDDGWKGQEVKFFLVVHQPLDERLATFAVLRERHPSDHSAKDDGTNVAKAGVHLHGDATGLDVHVGARRRTVQKIRHGKRQGFTAQQIRPVGENLDVKLFFGAGINVRSKEGQFVVDLRDVVNEALGFHQCAEQGLLHGDGWHVLHLANQWGSGRSYPARRSPLTAAVSWFSALRCLRSSMSMLVNPMRRSSLARSS